MVPTNFLCKTIFDAFSGLKQVATTEPILSTQISSVRKPIATRKQFNRRARMTDGNSSMLPRGEGRRYFLRSLLNKLSVAAAFCYNCCWYTSCKCKNTTKYYVCYKQQLWELTSRRLQYLIEIGLCPKFLTTTFASTTSAREASNQIINKDW